MATVASADEKATDILQKLSLEPKSRNHDAPTVTKENSAIPARDRSMTPVLQNIDPNMYYFPNGHALPYYYGGLDSMSEWEDYSRYMTLDGVEMLTGVYGDMYSGYGYAPYGSYPSSGSPGPTMGHDGQLYGPQHYQYSYYQPPSPANAPYDANQVPNSKGDVVSTSAASDQLPILVDAAKVNGNAVANGTTNGNNGSMLSKPSQQNLSLTSNGSCGRGALQDMLPSSGYHDPRMATDNSLSSTGSHVTNAASGRNQNPRPLHHLMGLQNQRPTSGVGPVTTGMMNRMYPDNRFYNAFSTGLGFRSNFYDSRTNGQWGVVDGKYKPRGRGYGFYGYLNESFDGLTELNRGPRANRFKNQKGFGPTVTFAANGEKHSANGNVEDSSVVPDKDQYNKEEFPVDYSDAMFFIIKSYSEDDLHKSVKYNVWASTPNGNKKLDAAYHQAQQKTGGCPVFLFFSVNTSGQFVGVAEMAGPVDFNKTVDYWQQDKWTGCFAVKWHIVKDVPNSILKHIILENNDNKPVTNSRDTQEVKLEQGLQMIKLFKEHVSKTSIFDDFSFYETRQKVMQEKRAKQKQLRKQVVDGKPADSIDEKNTDWANGKPILHKPLEAITVLKKGNNLVGIGDRKPSENNVVANGVAVVPNGVVNGF